MTTGSDNSDGRRSHHPARPLTRWQMPRSNKISLMRYTDNRSVRIPKDLGPEQSLTGFNLEYRNIVDYIVRITHRIWETDDRNVEYIADCYAPDSIVYDDYGLQRGNQKIIDDTHHTTAAFPDIILDAEEVIWAGNDEVGFHTSHLTRIIGTNTGPSRYGPPTGRQVNFLVIANCVALQNDIFLEHVLYNTSAMLRQMGLDLWSEAERLVADPPKGWPRSEEVWNELRSAARPEKPISISEPMINFDPDYLARKVHDSIWNGDLGALDWGYWSDFTFEGTTLRKFEGDEAYRSYVGELRAAFPDLELRVDEVYWMGCERDDWLISTRWSAEGTHSGGSLYGEPTGHRCQIWGITQHRVEYGLIRQEWQLFNEFDLMMQIARARGAGSTS